MAHFVKLDENNIVTEVHVVSNDDIMNLEFPASEPVGIQFLKNIFGSDTVWKQTSYNSNFRFRYAGIDYIYDESKDVFLTPKYYDSWVLNEQTLSFQPPIAYPTDGKLYMWDETTTSWVEQI